MGGLKQFKECFIVSNNLIRKWKIYAYINQINGKIYIGQTCNSLRDRAGKNGNLYAQCKKFGRAIKKYGWKNFKPVVLLENLTRDEANLFETELIKKYDTTNDKNGYNISLGGNDNTFTSIDITNQRFGHLTALELVDTNKTGRHWLCRCNCGEYSVVRQEHLRNGTTKACIKCGCHTKKITPNDFEEDSNGAVRVLMSDGYSFMIDKESFNLIKDQRWHYDKKNGRIVSSSTGENILRSLYPQFKRQKFSRYVGYVDGDHCNLRKANLFIKPKKGINHDELMAFLQSDDETIQFVGNSGYRKKWRNKNTGEQFATYQEAVGSLNQEDNT